MHYMRHLLYGDLRHTPQPIKGYKYLQLLLKNIRNKHLIYAVNLLMD